MADTAESLVLRGAAVRVDEQGLCCLDDIRRAARFRKNYMPSEWSRLPVTMRKVERVLEIVVGKPPYGRDAMRRVIRRTASGEYFADVRLALDYAEYLNPKLAIEVKEVFLRFKAADATLADELLERATPEDNLWVARRAIGRAARNDFTREIAQRGVIESKHFAMCTNATYERLFGKTARQLKAEKGLPANANLRDKLDAKALAFLAASEALSVERMEDEDSQGFNQCHDATDKAASAIRGAIDSDRRNRQRKIV